MAPGPQRDTEHTDRALTAPHDRAARLHRALAEDSRTAELGVTVTVRDERVHLTGTVASGVRKGQVDAVVREAEPELPITNDVSVVSTAEPGEAEDIT